MLYQSLSGSELRSLLHSDVLAAAVITSKMMTVTIKIITEYNTHATVPHISLNAYALRLHLNAMLVEASSAMRWLIKYSELLWCAKKKINKQQPKKSCCTKTWHFPFLETSSWQSSVFQFLEGPFISLTSHTCWLLPFHRFWKLVLVYILIMIAPQQRRRYFAIKCNTYQSLVRSFKEKACCFPVFLHSNL